MSLTSGKYTRGLFLVLFVIASGLSLLKPTAQSGLVAILSLLGFACIEFVEAYKRPNYKDFTGDFEEISKRLKAAEDIAKEIKNDHSAVKMTSAFGTRK